VTEWAIEKIGKEKGEKAANDFKKINGQFSSVGRKQRQFEL